MIRWLTATSGAWRATDHNSQERGAMKQHWIDDLWFSVENYDAESSNRLEMLVCFLERPPSERILTP
jgi:hypothetical protein